MRLPQIRGWCSGLPTGRTPVGVIQRAGFTGTRGALSIFRRSRPSISTSSSASRRSHPGQLSNLHGGASLLPASTCRPSTMHFLNGTAVDPAAECARYERAIADAGGIDLQILGIGTNGHIGFNEPARELDARTHRVTLKPETRRSNAALFGGDAVERPGAKRCRWGWGRSCGPGRLCSSRPAARRPPASSGWSTGRNHEVARVVPAVARRRRLMLDEAAGARLP